MASSVTLVVVDRRSPFTATWPPPVIVQALPLASSDLGAPANTIVSFGEVQWASVSAWPAAGLSRCRQTGDHDAFGEVSPHQSLLLFSCQIVPFT